MILVAILLSTQPQSDKLSSRNAAAPLPQQLGSLLASAIKASVGRTNPAVNVALGGAKPLAPAPLAALVLDLTLSSPEPSATNSAPKSGSTQLATADHQEKDSAQPAPMLPSSAAGQSSAVASASEHPPLPAGRPQADTEMAVKREDGTETVVRGSDVGASTLATGMQPQERDHDVADDGSHPQDPVVAVDLSMFVQPGTGHRCVRVCRLLGWIRLLQVLNSKIHCLFMLQGARGR